MLMNNSPRFFNFSEGAFISIFFLIACIIGTLTKKDSKQAIAFTRQSRKDTLSIVAISMHKIETPYSATVVLEESRMTRSTKREIKKNIATHTKGESSPRLSFIS
ncbi:MAG: hypothetical protein J6Y60_11690 [Treponema sp.]|nr:hypothetical protein [Treponema sp.]